MGVPSGDLGLDVAATLTAAAGQLGTYAAWAVSVAMALLALRWVTRAMSSGTSMGGDIRPPDGHKDWDSWAEADIAARKSRGEHRKPHPRWFRNLSKNTHDDGIPF